MSNLKAYILDIEIANTQIEVIREEIAELLANAKKDGFHVPTMKKLITNRKKGDAEVQQEKELLEQYEALLGST